MTSTEPLRPLLLLVDDDPHVLEALEAELAPRFGGLCRIEAYQRPEGVLEALERWTRESRSIALAIVDQRMPGITGVELLKRLRDAAGGSFAAQGETLERFDPAAATRTMLLTGYGGPEVAEAAHVEGRVHRYREKPWGGEELSRDVETLLGDYWKAARRESHPAYRDFVTAAELSPLWNQLERILAPAPAPAAGADEAEDPVPAAAMRASLRAALAARDAGVRPTEEALAAFLLGTASDAQRAEIRRAALASTEFRRELIYLLGQLQRLGSYEARLAFDETIVPDWVRKLAQRQA